MESGGAAPLILNPVSGKNNATVGVQRQTTEG
jgi:hypothetical protein